MTGVTRYFEVGAYGERTGRQLFLKPDAPMPQPTEGATWRADPAFTVADELLTSSGFKQVLTSVLKNGHEIIS
jgi:hypothetical protein